METKPTQLRSEVRVDGSDKVQGKALYGADIPVRNLLNAFVVRSSKHHARILDIDVSGAEKAKGVIKVLTAVDIPGAKNYGPMATDKPVLAYDKVRHVGDPIVLVVAKTKEVAEEAARKIVITYEDLPAVFDAEEALLPSAPQLHPGGNLLVRYDLSRGDAEKGFAESDVVIERTFHVQRISPGYLEPEVSTVEWQKDGCLKIWAHSQMPFELHKDVCQMLNLPHEKVQIHVPVIGGSFGGKSDATITLMAALCAYAVKGSVRVLNTREDSMVAHPKRHAGTLHYKMGAKKDGTFQAVEARFVFDTGAYASYGSAVGAISAEMAAGPYRTPHVNVATKIAYTNTPFCGSIRGVGGPQTSFAVESMVDIMAAELGMDPIEIRRKNIWRKNDFTYFGVELTQTPSIAKCLDLAEEARAELAKRPKTKGKVTGIGVASSLLKMGMGYGVPDDSTTAVEWLPEGKVQVWIGSPDIGQGIKTVSTQIVAEVLGIAIERIVLAPIDTSISPNSGPTNTSRSTMLVGNSLVISAKNAIELLLDFAAKDLRVKRETIHYEDGNIIVEGIKKQVFDFDIFSSRAAEMGISLKAGGTSSFPIPANTPKNLPEGIPHIMFCHGAHVALVEVDQELGSVEVKEYVAIHDVGKAINPKSVEGQIEGGVMMGVGYALMEKQVLRPNGTWIDNFTEYLLPTMADAPNIKSIIVEEANSNGPFGAIGLGEPVTVAIAPAIANAVFNATGKRVLSLPIKPEDIIG